MDPSSCDEPAFEQAAALRQARTDSPSQAARLLPGPRSGGGGNAHAPRRARTPLATGGRQRADQSPSVAEVGRAGGNRHTGAPPP